MRERLRQEVLGMCRMSARSPAGSASRDANATGSGGTGATAVSQGDVCSIDAAQQAQVQRTQNAGQPLSGTDSLAAIAQGSCMSSELSPLASPTKTTSSATKSDRRIDLQVYHARRDHL